MGSDRPKLRNEQEAAGLYDAAADLLEVPPARVHEAGDCQPLQLGVRPEPRP
jgi:hypothetical protein